jgi:TadE-like protein
VDHSESDDHRGSIRALLKHHPRKQNEQSMRLQVGCRKGQGLVEFALVLPVFLLIVMGLADLGRAVYEYNSITNAVREAARLAIVNQDTTKITARAVGQSSMAETGGPSVTVSFRDSEPNADPSSNPVCNPVAVGCVAIVRFETTFKPLTPIIGSFIYPSGVTFIATSVETIEFLCPNAAIPAIASSANCPKQP